MKRAVLGLVVGLMVLLAPLHVLASADPSPWPTVPALPADPPGVNS
ncbi:MAG: hypothetical protein QN183_13225 [Armatimonadota bacterium]|nr:hypothetical protein [Armatimonadota bacterium]MDR7485970.1 hypothetical protein [Armatimonadota bacterium]MDR7537312.1 hypothetical protein [Armatimonadota bacterium]